MRSYSLVISGFAFVIGCGGDSIAIKPKAVASVAVTPSDTTIWLGRTVQLSAAARDSSGAPIAATVSWIIVSGGISPSLSTEGLFRAGTDLVNTGTYTVAASAPNGVQGTARVRVINDVSSLDVQPRDTTLGMGESLQFRVTLKAPDGSNANAPVVWRVSPEVPHSVTQTGLFTATGGFTFPGPFSVQATARGITQSALVYVRPDPLAAIGIEGPVVNQIRSGEFAILVRAFDRYGNASYFPAIPVFAFGDPSIEQLTVTEPCCTKIDPLGGITQYTVSFRRLKPGATSFTVSQGSVSKSVIVNP